MRTDFVFKGMMVPVFTPFMDDKKLTINYDMIDKYCHHLKSMGMHGVMVHGMTGEVTTLKLEERMKLTEKWMEVTRKYDMKMLLNIGGTDLTDIYTMAEHAEKLKIDAVMVMPDLFYRPYAEEDLVMYIKDICMRMPTRPVFYYHIPMMTGVCVDMYRWMKMMEKEISMFAGLYWAHDQLDHVMLLKEKMPTYNYIIATGISMMGYMMQGFDAISMMAMNICPEMMKEMYDHMMNYRMREAMMLHSKMSKRFWDMMRLDIDMDWVTAMKLEMNKIMNMGPLRKPKMTMNRWWWMGRC